MTDKLDILVIDDEEVDRLNIQHLLDSEGVKADVHEASDCSSGIEKMKSNDIDCVLIDYKLPGTTGLEVLKELRSLNRNNVPLILFTGMGDEQLATEVMKKGASDYLSKSKLNGESLVRSIKNAIQMRSFEKQVRVAEKALADSEKSYRTIVETVSDVIFRLGPDQKVEFINPAIRFFGFEPEEIVGHPINKFVDMPPNGQDIISKIATQEVGPLSTSNLEVNIKESLIDGEVRLIPVLLDAFGLWNVSDEEVFKNDVDKEFLGTLCIARNIMEIKAVEEELLQTQHRLMDTVNELKKISTLDALTGIANRRFFDEYSEKEWRRAQRERLSFTVVMIDLDCFKSYNDTYGHQRGDACLKEVAEVIKNSMKRSSDLVARYGGEEFVLTLPDTDNEGGHKLAEQMRQKIMALNLEHKNNAYGKQITISLGVAAAVAEPGMLFYDLIANADSALYQAKRSGRNRTVVFDEEQI